MARLGLATLAAGCLLTASAFADMVYLTNGQSYSGTFQDGTSNSITFVDQNGMRHRWNRDEVQSIQFTSPTGAANTGAYNNGAYSNTNNVYHAGSNSSEIVLPAGSQLVVRTTDPIDATTATQGRTYSATIDRDALDTAGNVVVPRGSTAQLAVQNVSSGGTFGSGDLALTLQSVMVNGQNYMVNTGSVERSGNQGLGKNKRTAEMVGGGALLGTVIGAIAGGGSGAAIGAAAGAVAGGTAQVLTRGKEVKVPAESVLTFQLDQPLYLRRS